jgi:ubiquinone/menaquinone biosynthesis C-methylase UbiE
MKPPSYPQQYYSFQKYVTKHRMLTFWYQLQEVLAVQPSSVLEIGIGPGVVSAYLRYLGVKVTTVDINPSLQTDHVGSVLELQSIFKSQQFDLVLCARVLHHLPYNEFERALEQLAYVSKEHVLLTLPFNEGRLYLMTRYTSSPLRTFSLPLPLQFKQMVLRLKGVKPPTESSLWKIDDSKNTSLTQVRGKVSEVFDIIEDYRIPEDSAHYLMVLQKKKQHQK